MRDNERTLKIELLSQWKLEAEFRNSAATSDTTICSWRESSLSLSSRFEVSPKYVSPPTKSTSDVYKWM